MSYILRISGVDMPVPDELIILESDIDSSNSGRSQAGDMCRERIATKLKIDANWSVLTPAQASVIRNAVAEPSCEVEFDLFDEIIAKTMYAGDRTYTPNYDKNGKGKWAVALSLTEM